MRRFWLVALLLVNLPSPLAAQTGGAETAAPVFDISGRNFDSEPAVEVDKGWRIYWKQLLTPITVLRAEQPQQLTPGPGWSSNPGMEPLSYATYRLSLRLPHNHHGLSLYFPIINASSRIWLNGKWAAATGVVSDHPDRDRPELTTLLVPLPDKEETVDVMIQVANFTHLYDGLSGYPRIDRLHRVVFDDEDEFPAFCHDTLGYDRRAQM